MGLPQRLVLVNEMQIEMAIVFSRPGLDLLAQITDDQDDLTGSQAGHLIQNVTEHCIVADLHDRFWPAPGVRPHPCAITAHQDYDFHLVSLALPD